MPQSASKLFSARGKFERAPSRERPCPEKKMHSMPHACGPRKKGDWTRRFEWTSNSNNENQHLLFPKAVRNSNCLEQAIAQNGCLMCSLVLAADVQNHVRTSLGTRNEASPNIWGLTKIAQLRTIHHVRDKPALPLRPYCIISNAEPHESCTLYLMQIKGTCTGERAATSQRFHLWLQDYVHRSLHDDWLCSGWAYSGMDAGRLMGCGSPDDELHCRRCRLACATRPGPTREMCAASS